MNYQELKANFKHIETTVVLDEEGTIMGVLTNMDNLTQLIEEHWDLEVLSIDDCRLFDYDYQAEVFLTVDENGEGFNRSLKLYSATKY